jgi:hypothetical protein
VPAAIKNRLAFEVTRGVELFLSVEVGEAPEGHMGSPSRGASFAAWTRKLTAPLLQEFYADDAT